MMKRRALLIAALAALAASPALGQGSLQSPQPPTSFGFNPGLGQWGPAPGGPAPVFDPETGGWDLAPQGTMLQYDPYSGQWSPAQPGVLWFDPHTGKWLYQQ